MTIHVVVEKVHSSVPQMGSTRCFIWQLGATVKSILLALPDLDWRSTFASATILSEHTLVDRSFFTASSGCFF